MSSSALGDHRGLACPGCGVKVKAKDPALWLERSGREAVAWHHDCRIQALRDEAAQIDEDIAGIVADMKKPAPTLDAGAETG